MEIRKDFALLPPPDNRPRFPLKTFLFDTAKTTIGLFAFLWLVMETLDFFGIKTFNEHGPLTYYLIWLHVFGICVIGTCIKNLKCFNKAINQYLLQNETDEDDILSDELVSTVKRLHKSNEHMEVTRMGKVLSRPLWISGRYEQRIAIGTFFEDSAARLGSTEDQALALIDDLGWTNAVIGNIEQARKNISHGIDLAAKSKNRYLEAKGIRHLGVMEQKFLQNTDKAQKLLQDAENIASNIPDKLSRSEMMAGILFNRAEGLLQMLNYPEAKDYATNALKKYKKLKDHTRTIKVLTLIARIDMASGEIGRAKDGFRAALTEAKRHSRRDEVGKSLLGLGESYLRESSFDLAETALGEALIVFHEIGLRPEAERAEDLLRRARKQDSILT